MERRLSAIMSADVVGYSRLMAANEVATLEALMDRRAAILEPLVDRHGGRVFKFTGDGLLAEFPSVIGAVESALAIQQGMRQSNADLPDDRRIDLRIGIHVGDVIPRDGDLYGDGVNLAARIEGVARPGCIALSQMAREHIGNRLELALEDRGPQRLKNIDRPIHVFEIVPQGVLPGAEPCAASAASAERISIAVLPFDNMSGDPEQEYFSDGICEDIITELSRVEGLFVVGRNSSFVYKNRPVTLPLAARELGVAYLLEGSVRKAGERVRVTAQLIDGTTGGHVWADRYDRDLTDIFAIQDELTKAIVAQLRVRLLPDEQAALGQPPTQNVEAYNHFLQGRHHYYRLTRVSLRKARQLFARAVELDPQLAPAIAGIASCDSYLNAFFDGNTPPADIVATAERALAIDASLAAAHAARGQALNLAGREREAEAAFAAALSSDPDSYEANLAYAKSCVVKGRHAAAVSHLRRALEVRPEDYIAPLVLGQVLRTIGADEEAVKYERLGLERAEEALRREPHEARPAHMGAPAWANQGEPDTAIEWMERAKAIDPDDPFVVYNSICLSAQLGRIDEALDHLERFVPLAGQDHFNWIGQDPDMDPLRDHPRFKRLLEAIAARFRSPVAT